MDVTSALDAEHRRSFSDLIRVRALPQGNHGSYRGWRIRGPEFYPVPTSNIKIPRPSPSPTPSLTLHNSLTCLSPQPRSSWIAVRQLTPCHPSQHCTDSSKGDCSAGSGSGITRTNTNPTGKRRSTSSTTRSRSKTPATCASTGPCRRTSAPTNSSAMSTSI